MEKGRDGGVSSYLNVSSVLGQRGLEGEREVR